MANFRDPKDVLDDLERQVARATIANIALETFDNHVRQQIYEAVHEAAYQDVLNYIESNLSQETRDILNALPKTLEHATKAMP